MKKLIEKIKQVNFKYFFAELLIVVAGILIAVSLNSWQEDNANKNREQFYLKSLKSDFEQSLKSLNEILYQNRISETNVNKLLKIISEPDNRPPADSIRKLFWHLFGFNRFVPASGTYKEIISTGSMQILRDNELRVALSSWDDMILRNRQLEDVMFWQYHLFNQPYLNKHTARADFSRDNISVSGRGNKTDYKKLFADTEFENILLNRAGALKEANEYINIMIEYVNHINNLINKSLTD